MHRPRGATPPRPLPAARDVWRPRAPWLAAAAALALAAALGAGWARERGARLAVQRDLRTRTDRLLALVRDRAAGHDAARDTLLAGVAARDSTVGALNALVAALTEPGVRTARLTAPSAATGTAAGAPEAVRLTWNRRRGVVVVTAARLAQPQPGRVYQLWGIAADAQPQSLGVFRPARDGTVRAVLRVPPGASMEQAAVTVEPEGGSTRPTERPRMVGTIGAE